MNFWTKLGYFLGQKRLIFGQSETNYGTKQGDILGQEKLILGHKFHGST
jgi:hypothetical protein